MMDTPASDTPRKYDLIVYGATGFVGRQVVGYLSTPGRNAGIRWAIAGRDATRLKALQASLDTRPDVVIADSTNQEAVEAMAAGTRVLLNVAGPFALYGTRVVDACVRSCTDYVDITGETPWIRQLIDRYHEQAAERHTRIITACGFDSVPSDLGTLLAVRSLQRRYGTPCLKVRAYFRMKGGFNGGTIASAFNLHESGASSLQHDPFLLNPRSVHTGPQVEDSADVEQAVFDGDIQTWVAPFIMAPINTRIVRRSAALLEEFGEGYGKDFTYNEFLKVDSPHAKLKARTVVRIQRLIGRAMAEKPGRRFLQRIFPKPGEGPSEEAMATGWFRCELEALGEDGHRARVVMRHQGDPGNRATARLISECALSLLLERPRLAGGNARGGVLTPASGIGEVLAERLQRSGMEIEVQFPETSREAATRSAHGAADIPEHQYSAGTQDGIGR